MAEPRFDVALSFAGEDRGYVHQVATALRDRGVSVFYDEFNTGLLWGHDLYSYLDELYSSQCRHVLVFTSASYVRGTWTSHERRSIQARLITQPEGFLLLVKLDDTQVTGFRNTLAYVDGRLFSPHELAELVLVKIGDWSAADRAPSTIQVPLSEEGLLRAIAERPTGWEHLLLAGTIWREWERLGSKRLDHELGVATTTDRYVRETELAEFVQTNLDTLAATISNVEAVVGSDRLAWAMGPPGTMGDVNRIQHLGLRFGTACEALFDWAAAIRASVSAAEVRIALRLLAGLADEPVRQLGEFVESLVIAAGLISEAITAGDNAPGPIVVDLHLRLAQQVMDELLAEVSGAGARG